MLPSRQKKRAVAVISNSILYEVLVTHQYLELEQKIIELYEEKNGKLPDYKAKENFRDVLMPKAEAHARKIISELADKINFGSNSWYIAKKFGPIFALSSASTYCAYRLLMMFWSGKDPNLFIPMPADPLASVVAVALPWSFVIAALISEFKS